MTSDAVPTRANLRKLLNRVFPTADDFDAFFSDCFPERKQACDGNMSRKQKTTALLESEDVSDIVKALQEYEPAAVQKSQHLMAFESVDGAKRADSSAGSVGMAPQTVAEASPQGTAMDSIRAKPSLARAAYSSTVNHGRRQVDVVVVTALKEEYDEALKVQEGARGEWTLEDVSGTEVAFRDFQADAASGVIRVAMAWTTRMRGVATAAMASSLLDGLGARMLAMCGVCAGRRGKVAPGDVILAELVYTYNMGATQVEKDEQGIETRRFQSEPNPFPLNEKLLRRAQSLREWGKAWVRERPLTLASQCDWVLAELAAGRDPLTNAERITFCPAWTEVLDRLQKRQYLTVKPRAKRRLGLTPAGQDYIGRLLIANANRLPSAEPWRLHVAPMATGPDVMRDPGLFQKLSESMRKVLGVDMEAAALAQVAHSRELPWLVMKGVMDHADQDKDDLLKSFAARASAECLFRFLRASPLGEQSSIEAGSEQSGRLRVSGVRSAPAPHAPAPITDSARPYRSASAEPLRKKILALLATQGSLTQALIDVGYGNTALAGEARLESVWMALWQQDVSKLTLAFVQLAARPNLDHAARQLLCMILPLAAAWESILQAATGQGEDEGTWALRTETLAEVLIARQDGRDAEFATGKPYLQGMRHIPLPPIVRSSLIDPEGRELCNAILDDLAAESQVERVPNRSFWVTLQGAHPGLDAFRDAAKTRVQQRATAGQPFYLLYIDELDSARRASDRDRYWNHVRKAIQSQIPGLRVVRLTAFHQEGKPSAIPDEKAIAFCILDMFPSSKQ